MSWFDTTGLANIAKSALKEAQRTIDKALDIKDDENTSVPTNTPVDTNPDDFFGTWGVTIANNANKDVAVDKKGDVGGKNMASSIWGSFTGSFFDTANKESKNSQSSVDFLDDSDVHEHFKTSKLVVQSSEDGDVSSSFKEEFSSLKSSDSVDFVESLNENDSVTPSLQNSNKLSSTAKNSSESMEILSGTGCTTSPESEAFSITRSLSTSSSDLKRNSESVEVIFESLNSPSSVEVIPTSSSLDIGVLSQNTDEFVSPIQSPGENISTNSLTPDSIEVITDEAEVEKSQIDEESLSISYNSISENTTVDSKNTKIDSKNATVALKTTVDPKNTIVDPKNTIVDSKNATVDPKNAFATTTKNQNQKDTETQSTQKSELQKIDKTETKIIDKIEPIIKPPIKSKTDISTLLKNYNVIDIPTESETNKIENTENPNNSNESIETTILTSSNTSNSNLTLMDTSSEASTTTEININANISDNSSNNSLKLKNLLEDALFEKLSDKKINLEASKCEISSAQSSTGSSNFETINIKSNQTSAHTSGDELETATSSDIEIISSPNGDSSSTQSRHSPAKLNLVKGKTAQDMSVDLLLEKMAFKKIKGHNRELSEASTLSDDFSLHEIDPLMRRINEMSEILECREAKLVELGRKFLESQETNIELKRQLDQVLDEKTQCTDLSQVTEEYTQRLSALERKFQQAIREKDSLRKQLDVAKQEASVRLSKCEFEAIINEKDETISQLREEGEKLSKQQLQHCNIIKKLRAKEKENEATIKHLREKVEELSSETERLKRTLAAKEEVERTQIEAVHQLTAKNKKLEKDSAKLQSDFEDLTNKYETTKKSLDAAKTELADKNRANNELIAQEKQLQNLENERKMTKSQIEDVTSQLEVLRNNLLEANLEHNKKEEVLKQENHKLWQKLEESERKNEELSQSVLEVSKPLIFQIDSLQATNNKKTLAFEKTEASLNLKINELTNKLQNALISEKNNKEDNCVLRQKLNEIEVGLSKEMAEKETLKMDFEHIKTELVFVKDDLNRKIENYESQLTISNGKVEFLDKEIELLQTKLAQEIEKRKLQETSKNDYAPVFSKENNENASPTPSVGRASIADSFSSSFWPPDEPFENVSTSRCTNMLEIQLLQTNLKQREGEVQQFQWELNRREHERTLLNNEISDLMNRIEGLEVKLTNHETLNSQFTELQQQYDTLCQLYGEKVEETEELKLDLEDVKDMYKIQIDELLKQQKASSSSS